MARRYIPIYGDKLRIACRERGLSYRKLARELDIKWELFCPYLYERNNVPPELLERICEYLKLDIDDLRKEDDRDLKAEMLQYLNRVQIGVAIGKEELAELGRAFKTVAPYFLTRPTDEAEAQTRETHLRGLRDSLDAIINAGEPSDDTDTTDTTTTEA